MKAMPRLKSPLMDANIEKLAVRAKQTDPNRVTKSANVNSEYRGITKYGELVFRTTSESTPGKYWFQTLEFPSLQVMEKLYKQGELADVAVVTDIFKNDNVKVYCNDPSFLYWAWKYMAWSNNYGMHPETRKPTKRNVQQKGSVCKHLLSVFEILNDSTVMERITNDINMWAKATFGGGFIKTAVNKVAKKVHSKFGKEDSAEKEVESKIPKEESPNSSDVE